MIIFFLSILPLTRLLKKEKPDFIAHLLTSLPILIFNLLNTKTKLVLRISGFQDLLS